MCKTYRRTYACDHWIQWRPSICHGAFAPGAHSTNSDDQSIDHQYKAFCSGAALIDLQSPQSCGNCLRSLAEAKLEEIYTLAVATAHLKAMEIVQIEGSNSNHTEMIDDAAFQRDQGLYVVNRDFPDCRYRSLRRPTAWGRARQADQRKQSLLRRPVLPEDVIDSLEASKWAWSSGWSESAASDDAGDMPWSEDASTFQENDIEHLEVWNTAEAEDVTPDIVAEASESFDQEQIILDDRLTTDFRNADEVTHENHRNETGLSDQTSLILGSPRNGLVNCRANYNVPPIPRLIDLPVSRVQQRPSSRKTCSSSSRRASTGQLSMRSGGFNASHYVKPRIAVSI